MSDHEHQPQPHQPGRDPCPKRIWSDSGGAFAMGCVAGSMYHGFKGLRNAPRGGVERIFNSSAAIKKKAPALGGSFAVWGLFFSTFDCSLAYARGHEDAWNAIAAGALTGGVLAIRSGYKAAARSAAMGGLILAIIEGATYWMTQGEMPLPPRSGGGGGGSYAPTDGPPIDSDVPEEDISFETE
eukprot:CAMPEP_0119122040 /NCGR_PEP_ID=MMETSP1310-20130426/2412_1 /TAXON_ID=464262 /ORGANISM="Genus nov. species nov., Strain RCC2339" /LENGTH=183 /DNA_ID=CAMNT_0007111645 /DNA_START=53 /DNA_END=601 /DNA_ORIENTATION=+